VLDAFDQLQVCTAYKINGETIDKVPFQMNRVAIEPKLESFPGWKSDITALKNYDALPEQMKGYIQFIHQFLAVGIHYISNGPGRDQLIENL
ncbi:MAG TPA: adenylosuccinate synthetase, partial [Puia sp.]|nr:adenylosuccinate synthetase [Puia sp.]